MYRCNHGFKRLLQCGEWLLPSLNQLVKFKARICTRRCAICLMHKSSSCQILLIDIPSLKIVVAHFISKPAVNTFPSARTKMTRTSGSWSSFFTALWNSAILFLKIRLIIKQNYGTVKYEFEAVIHFKKKFGKNCLTSEKRVIHYIKLRWTA